MPPFHRLTDDFAGIQVIQPGKVQPPLIGRDVRQLAIFSNLPALARP